MYRYRRSRDLDSETDAYEILKDDLLAEIESRRRWEETTRHRRTGLWGKIRGRGDYNRSAARLRGELARELRAIQAVENRAGRTRDPLVREIIYELLEEAREQGVSLNELTGYYNGGLRGRLASLAPGGGAAGTSWLLPSLLLLLAVPQVRQGLKPLAKKVVEGAMDISDKINELLTTAKEEVEDIVAEVNFEKIRDSLNVPDETPAPEQ